MRNVSLFLGTSGLVAVVAAGYAAGCVSVGADCALLASCAEYADAGPGGTGGQDGGGGDARSDAMSDAPVVDCAGPPMKMAGGPDTSCGVFAEPGVAAGGDGSKKSPFASLQAALDAAAIAGKPVYACAKEFDESVHLPSGLVLYGGLDCTHGWAWTAAQRTRIKAPATATTSGATEIAVRLGAGAGKTVIEDVDVIAAGGALPGVSSVAVLIEDTAAELTRSKLTAGDGTKGEDGVSPAHDPGLDGFDGVLGFNICGADVTNPGPAGSTKPCGAQTSAGGQGGDGGMPSGASLAGGDGQAGAPSDPASPGGGLAGKGQSAMACTAGVPGADGAPGSSGLGSTGTGAISTSGYAGTAGTDGLDGKPGQGGGGGGGAKGKLQIVCLQLPTKDRAGATGGSGGTGGCGGVRGGGGKAGGSSIALLSLATHPVTLTGVVLDVGNGGDGGKGGDGQDGGGNGSGANGGQGANGASAGCAGGNGGHGGAGGPGGGGLGGHAIGVAHGGTAPQGTPTVTFKTTPPTVGLGGAAGANNTDPVAGKGADGTSGPLVKL